MNEKRVLALDIGDRRIGVAVSDALGLTAQGVGVIENKGVAYVVEQIRQLCARYDCGLIVVGDPINMDGSKGARSALVCDFVCQMQQALQIPCILHDERLSTKEAQRALEMMGVNWRKQKKSVDMMAAQIILRSYMDTKK